MNIDDYMDMQHDLAEADVIAFENEIDYLHKELEVYKKALKLVIKLLFTASEGEE